MAARGARRYTLLPLLARTASGSGASFHGLARFKRLSAALSVTARSGTTPTLDVKVQHSVDGGTTWFDLITFTQATAVGNELKSVAVVDTSSAVGIGNSVKVVWTVGGTTPSFTFKVNLQASA